MKEHRWLWLTAGIQVVVMGVVLVGVWGAALLFARDQVRTIVADVVVQASEACAIQVRAAVSHAPLPVPLKTSIIADGGGRVVAWAGALPQDRDELPSLAAMTRVPHELDIGEAVPLADGGWLVTRIDERWVDERVEDMHLPLALLCAVAGLVIYPVVRLVSVRATRRAYRGLRPTQVHSLRGAHLALLRSISDGAVAVDAQDRILWANRVAQDLLRITGSSSGRSVNEVLPAPLRELLTTSVTGENVVVVGLHVMLVSIGDEFPGTTGPIRLLMLRDRTALVKLADERDSAIGRTQTLRSRAHEFENTLHVINGLLELGLVARAREFISAGGLRADIENGAVPITDDYVRALVLAHRTTAREKGITLLVDVEPRPQGLDDREDDREALLTVVGNLLTNAVEACAQGDTVRLHLRAPTADEIHVTVEDSGPGVPAEISASVLQEGVSTKQAAAPRGLGLALVRSVVERRGGRIAVGGSELGGARFHVTMPLGSPQPRRDQ